MRKKREKVDENSHFSKQSSVPFDQLEHSIEKFARRYGVDLTDVLGVVRKRAETQEILIPVSVFNEKLGSLETVCKYLHENLGLNYHEIAVRLKRDDRTVWITYRNAVRKLKSRFVVRKSRYVVPVSIIADRKLSVLESIVAHLKQQNLTYCQIGKLLRRDERNIWTVYDRAKKKWKTS